MERACRRQSCPKTRTNKPTAASVPRDIAASPRIGRCELRVAYNISQERLLPATSIPVALPLITPEDGRLSYDQLVLAAPAGDDQPPQGAVECRPSAPLSRRAARRPGADEPPTGRRSVAGRHAQGTTGRGIDDRRARLDSNLAGRGFASRAGVYRFASARRVATLALPAGVVLPALEVRLDGSLPISETDRDGGLPSASPLSLTPPEHLLELRYHFSPRDWGSHRFCGGPVQAGGLGAAALLAGDSAPAGTSALFSLELYARIPLGVGCLGYRREPTLEQPDLEAWIGATAGEPPPADSNRYLFSSLGRRRIWRSGRRAFGPGFCRLAIRALDRNGADLCARGQAPQRLFAAGDRLLAGALLEPEAALLLRQASALGNDLGPIGGLAGAANEPPT